MFEADGLLHFLRKCSLSGFLPRFLINGEHPGGPGNPSHIAHRKRCHGTGGGGEYSSGIP